MTKLWHVFYSVTGCLLVLGLLGPMAMAQQPREARPIGKIHAFEMSLPERADASTAACGCSRDPAHSTVRVDLESCDL